jgi:hypothetical protein
MSSSLDVGGTAMSLFNDEDFAAIRRAFGVADNFLRDFDFGSLDEGGGKGGNLMGFTKDRQYIVKELNKTDHNTLGDISGEYREHIVGNDPKVPSKSLLCRFFAHFQHPKSGKKFCVMNNWLPPDPLAALELNEEEEKVVKEELQGSFSAYDLKGTADDKTLLYHGKKVTEVHKRIWDVSQWGGTCFWSDMRHEYWKGKKHAYETKFHVTPQQREWIVNAVKYDCEWLAEKGLMDYSLIVGIKNLKPSNTVLALEMRCSLDQYTQPLVCNVDGKVQLVYLGFIDFLQDWTCAKTCARCIKSLEPNKSTEPPPFYAARCISYFTNKFSADAKETVPLSEAQLQHYRQVEAQMAHGVALSPAAREGKTATDMPVIGTDDLANALELEIQSDTPQQESDI